jgi:sec-independent protein translocase protein TatA
VSQAVFQSIGIPELLIVLAIVLLIVGPKKLPLVGRQLGSGMREFKDSITGKRGSSDDDEDDETTRAQADSALGRPDTTAEPVDGEVVRERAPR